ncbi:MAG: NUDIX hydrolase, partial [Candidatus Zixiibacteriota bacterium]
MMRKRLDEELLFKRKARYLGYIYCPLCGSEFQERRIEGRMRLKCGNDSCGYIYYHNPIPAAGALAIKDGKILLVRRAAPPKIGWWCLPAGFMEWSEHPSDTAIRELREETGLNVRLESLFEVYSGQDDPRTNAVLILYVASVVDGNLVAADDALEARFFGFDELPDRIAFISHRQALEDYRKRYLK